MGILIAVVDDEPDILNLVSIHLKKSGFSVQTYPKGLPFLHSLEKTKPDLVILDLMLPDIEGFDICKKMKTDADYSDIPVIMLTAKGQELDKITGLDLGADDYVTKPFSPRELVSRIKAVLRRAGKSDGSIITHKGIIIIDPERFEVRVMDELINLTAVEFKILHMLCANKGKVFSREKILDQLWGNDKAVTDRTVDVHIKNLRDKLGEAASVIQNVRGVGYKVEA